MCGDVVSGVVTTFQRHTCETVTTHRLDSRDRWLVPASFLLSVVANDGEEWLTMSRTAQATARRLPRWAPVRGVLERGISQRHVSVSVGLMSLLYAMAAADGVRTRGRGRLFQDVQLVFGAHGFFHLAASAVTHGYTTGVATSPTVVLPQWWWATRHLRRAGVPRTASLPRALTTVGGCLVVAHCVGWLVAQPQARCVVTLSQVW